MTTKTSNGLMALDVGDRRIGVAVANRIARLAHPYGTFINDESIWQQIAALVKAEDIGIIVVGLPRSLQSEDTGQTRSVRNFASELQKQTGLKVVFQDEALTSRQAEAELRSRGKQFAKGEIDALAATYILEDYLANAGSIDSMEAQT